MSDFEDAVGGMVDDLLAEAGGAFIYHRGTTSTTVRLRKSNIPAQTIETENGIVFEINYVDFICRTNALPYNTPLRGDKITGDGKMYEVLPAIGDSVTWSKSDQMVRIHTKQIG